MKNNIKSIIYNKNIFILIIIFCISSVCTYGQGINFERSIKESFQKASAKNKYLFVDVYTTWCGPCKDMDKNVFPKIEVGKFFNDNFINIKVDAERGDGIAFAQKYEVNAYPTLLILDAKGKVIRKREGSTDAKGLINFAKSGIDKEIIAKNKKIEDAYLQNPGDFTSFTNYFYALNNSGDFTLSKEVYDAFVNKYSSKLTYSRYIIDFIDNSLDFINITDPLFAHLSSRYPDYSKLAGVDKVNNIIKSVYTSSIYNALTANDQSIKKVKEQIKKDNNLDKKTKGYLSALVDLYEYKVDVQKVLQYQGMNYFELESEENNIINNYRNALIEFVTKYQELISPEDLMYNYVTDLEMITLNFPQVTKPKDKDLTKLWLKMAYEKANGDPRISAFYAERIFREGQSYYFGFEVKKSEEKAQELLAQSKKIIKEAMETALAEKLQNNATLDWLYDIEDTIKKGYNQEQTTKNKYDQANEVIDIIKNECLYEVDTEAYKASLDSIVQAQGWVDQPAFIRKTLSSLDRYCELITYQDASRDNAISTGVIGGVGLNLEMIDNKPTVVNLVKGASANKANVRIGDIITHINNKKINRNDSIPVITSSITGKIGSSVNIKFLRNKKSYSVKLERKSLATANNAVATSYMLNKTLGYIKLVFFEQGCHQEVKNHIKNLLDQGMTKLILDLTDNPGGSRDDAIAIADEFLGGKGKIVTEKNRKGETVHRAKVKGVYENRPLVVMINENSASASELLSGALQDHDRAVFVGRKSFGKGLVQGFYGLNSGDQLILTISKFIAPSGRCVQISNKLTKEQKQAKGLLTHKDSIDFTGFPVFNTQKGSTVYGNCGIMPDIFVPKDLRHQLGYHRLIHKKRLIFRFVIEYLNINDNSAKLKKFGQEKFIASKLHKNVWNDFLKFTQNELTPTDSKILTNDILVKAELQSFMAQVLWGDDAYFKIINPHRPEYVQAVKSSRQ